MPLRPWALIALALAMTPPAFAQTTGRIAGRVTDSTGAVIVAAEVTAVNQATAQSRTALTNDLGT